MAVTSSYLAAATYFSPVKSRKMLKRQVRTSFLKHQRLQGLKFLKADLLTVRFPSLRNAELDVVENVLLARELNSYRKSKNETRFSKPRRKRLRSSHLLRAAALKMPIAGLLRSSLHLRRNFKPGEVKSIWLS